MSATYLQYLVMIAIEFVAIWYFARQGFHWLNVLLIANMILVTIFAPILLHFPIGISNIGNFFYAHIPVLMFLIVKNYGSVAARRVIKKTLLVLLVIAVFRFLIISIDDSLVVNQESFKAYKFFRSESYLIGIASFAGFYCSFFFFLTILEKLKDWNWIVTYLIGMIVWQLVDSLIFFPAVFLNTSANLMSVAEIMLVGFSLKVLIGVIATPLIFTKWIKKVKVNETGADV